MFPTTSLFGLCPVYPTCTNRGFPPCLFSHSKPAPQLPSASTSTPSNLPQKRPNESKDDSVAKRKALPTVVVKSKAVESKESDRASKEGNRLSKPATLTSQGSTVASSSASKPLRKEPGEANVNVSFRLSLAFASFPRFKLTHSNDLSRLVHLE